MSEESQVYDILKEASVVLAPADHLMAEKQFLPVPQKDQRVGVMPYTSPAKIVTVLYVPFEVDDNRVRFVLNRYGKVLAAWLLEWQEYPGLSNGIRQYRVELKKDIPSSLSYGGRDCLVSYDGQPQTCLKCGLSDH